MIQTYLIEFPWQGKLFQMIDPPQSDPLSQVSDYSEMIYEEACLFIFLCYQITTLDNQ